MLGILQLSLFIRHNVRPGGLGCQGREELCSPLQCLALGWRASELIMPICAHARAIISPMLIRRAFTNGA
jgi:hypothetical protein